ncbi:flagellar filament capping protein FliD [Paenibacillus sp. HWE-109]|uniref:flagellar filament capping protein FliD n=1 Tax=Paenibacillus sp. HWE-109 TaxID=1306526 RepID=UPI001EDF7DD8|nr:flagellar filament capping protein FliD [Paenibacillus sp. HWE-109]UKS26145.1 flagellar filament capping protein FliD [Paenibacillus sp. HWE-109]
MPTRVSGLGSGLEVDSLVSQMMQAKRVPIDKMTQKVTYLDWQRDAYRSMNTDVSAFMKEAQKLTFQTNILAKKSNMSTADADKVKVTPTSNALNGNFSLKVSQIAKNATTSSSSTVLGGAAAATDPLADADATLKVTGELGAVNVEITYGDSLNKIVSKINEKTSLSGVKAVYDKISDKITLVSTQTGEASTIKIVDEDGTNLLHDKLKLSTGSTPYETTLVKGQDAKVDLNGSGEVTIRTNSFTLSNINFSLMVDPGTPANAYTVNGTVNMDTDKIVETIKGVFDKYNDIISKINDKLGETKYRSYTPLTSAQKEKMSDSDIKLWEEKAKSGLLKGDSILGEGIEKMRRALANSVSGIPNGQINNLADIGITTARSTGGASSLAYLEKGKIYIDEDKLRKALSDSPDEVVALFTKDGARKADGKLVSGNDAGVGTQLYEILKNDMISGLSQKTQIVPTRSYLNIQIDDYTSRISKAEYALTDYEQGLYSKYAQMEKALSKLNSQGSQLANFFQSK